MRPIKDEDDPKRCRGTAVTKGGQCRNEAEPPGEYCLAHGGRSPDAAETKAYLTEQFERRLKLGLDAGEEIKLLRENLMSLNMVIASRTNLMKDEASLLVHAKPVADLIMQAEKVTVSLQRLALASGELLGASALQTWGQEITAAVADMVNGKYDEWEDDLYKLGDTIAGIIVQAKNTEDDKK